MTKIKKRSKIRKFCGRIFYRFKREYDWRFSGKQLALQQEDTILTEVIFDHRTPLYRNIPRHDLWLQENKIINLRLAVSKLNGLVLQPGEVFSFWRLVGKPSRRKGYVEGMVLDHGCLKPGIGGGLCQLTNIIYWMTLHTPLIVVERWRHSYDVFPDVDRTQPFGSGATCAYPSLDLQIKNSTVDSFQLRLWLTDTHLEGEWRSENPSSYRFEVYEADHWITYEQPGIYVRHNTIRRKVLAGEMNRDELVTENHAMMRYEPLLTDGREKKGLVKNA